MCIGMAKCLDSAPAGSFLSPVTVGDTQTFQSYVEPFFPSHQLYFCTRINKKGKKYMLLAPFH